MSESPREPESSSGVAHGEGAFGAPPGSSQWAEPPRSAPTQPYPSAPQPQLQYQQQPQYQQGYPPAYPPQPAYPPPAYPPPPGYAGYAPSTTTPFPVSTFVLLVVSVISLVATGIIGIPSAILAVLAWRQNGHDPAAARRRTMRAWIVYAINFAVAIPLLIWFYVWALGNQ